jgi:ribulose kinase
VAPNNQLERVVSGAACVVRIDFGTDSVRSLVADSTTGRVLGTSAKPYPRWARGLYCDPVEAVYRPDPDRAKRYDRLYQDDQALGAFVESEVKRRSWANEKGT